MRGGCGEGGSLLGQVGSFVHGVTIIRWSSGAPVKTLCARNKENPVSPYTDLDLQSSARYRLVSVTHHRALLATLCAISRERQSFNAWSLGSATYLQRERGRTSSGRPAPGGAKGTAI
jgi:hypothetical protein